MMIYRKLECGIVIQIDTERETSDWPYGPRQGTLAVNATPATREEFQAQANRAWQVIAELGDVLQAADRTPYYDVTFAAIGYAALTYDPTRGASMRTHALRLVKFAVSAAQRQASADNNAALLDHQAHENFIGQIEANVDIYRYKAALSREQWLLLLARYDSGLSLDDIAREFGYASRTTAKYKIEQALSVCRRLPISTEVE